MNDKLIKELMEKKKRLEGIKENNSRIQGALDSLFSQLKEKFGCKTEEEAEDKSNEMEREIEEKNEELENLIKEWEDKYGNNRMDLS